jgi:transcriptional regulator with XRE-family HTH domain
MDEDFVNRIAAEVRRLRNLKSMTQAEFAEQFGCSQGAISKFESGDIRAVSLEMIRRFCAFLNIGLDPTEFERELPGAPKVVFCSVAGCPRNTPFLLKGCLHFQPWMIEAHTKTSIHCPGCGEPLSDCCPSRKCRAVPVAGAAFCMSCGVPLIGVPKYLANHHDPKQFIADHLKQQASLTLNVSVRKIGIDGTKAFGSRAEKQKRSTKHERGEQL